MEETTMEILPADNGLPRLVIPALDQETPHLEEYRLLVRCIRGTELSRFATFGQAIYVGSLRFQRYHAIRPFPASRIFHIACKYVQKTVFFAYLVYLRFHKINTDKDGVLYVHETEAKHR